MEKSDKRMRLKAAELKDPRGHVLGCEALWPPVSLDNRDTCLGVQAQPPLEADLAGSTGASQWLDMSWKKLSFQKVSSVRGDEMNSTFPCHRALTDGRAEARPVHRRPEAVRTSLTHAVPSLDPSPHRPGAAAPGSPCPRGGSRSR
ncbi:hypothetical protein MDA_GLEAN10021279 [Myotis davidii]|uniref:Uncharacterized protein n=1 Tax=Myotis davidii TaxID=225400 RepID=L5MEP4_MYODS|nr:hypothetical protein MDA_GLEAN10021279 [Myotis davidii]